MKANAIQCRRGWLIVVLTALVALVVGCGKNAKNEQQYWTNHQQEMTEFEQKWPGFKALLDVRKAKAQPMWDEAQKISDEEQKAEKMAAANAALFEGLPSKMSEIKYKSQGIESTIKKLNGLKLPKSKQSTRSDAVSRAMRAVSEVDEAMRNAKPANEQEALALVDDQVSKLISEAGAADRAYSSLNAKPSKGKKGNKK
ncbi:MAG: hypothetical protein ACOC1F_14525 [Myxococcota bacterium]